MQSVEKKMSEDHSRCDELFAGAEESIADGDWETGIARFSDFNAALEHHFQMEELVMFPAFEERSGMFGGPTQMMRSEHTQMRDLLFSMADAVQRRDQDDYLGYSDTLLTIMQQHNAKEEQILYPMVEQALSERLETLIQEMDAL